MFKPKVIKFLGNIAVSTIMSSRSDKVYMLLYTIRGLSSEATVDSETEQEVHLIRKLNNRW